MNHPIGQQQYAWSRAVRLVVLVAALAGLFAQAGTANAATDAWLAAETAATLEIVAPDNEDEVDTGPVTLGAPWSPRMHVSRARLGRSWHAPVIRVRSDRIGRIWQYRPFRAHRGQPGRQLADTRRNHWPSAPDLGDLGVFLPRAARAATTAQWDVLGVEMHALGIDPSAVVQAPAEKPAAKPSMEASFGGELDPAWPKDELARKLKRLQHHGFDVPIVPVRQLRGIWRTDYDEFFNAIGSTTPMLGLCVGQMDVQDLLAVPEFLRRYEGKYHSVIVNYDLTNGHVDGMQGPPAFRAAVDRVSLALSLAKRATPSVYTWLAVGYNRAPTWYAWVAAFDREQYSAVMLSGHSAVSACVNPTVAKQIRKQMGKRLPDTQIGLVDFRLHTLDSLLYGRDDLGIQRYSQIRSSLKRAGITPLHIRCTMGH